MSKKDEYIDREFERVEKAIEKKDRKQLEKWVRDIGEDKTGGVLDVFKEKKEKDDFL